MLELAAAFLVDLAVGDPVYTFHPVRLMGAFIARGETFSRRLIRNEKLAGILLAVSLPLIVWSVCSALLYFLHQIHPALFWTVNAAGIYSALSMHDLRKEGFRVYHHLKKNDLDSARQDLARIVGRDTGNLSKEEIVRGTVETVAESTLDGIIAPLFFAALGGAPLALAYKAVNTLDSMIGHKTERYLHFGWFAARQDEIWNRIPSWLSAWIIPAAAFFVNGRLSEAAYVAWNDGVAAPHGSGTVPQAAFSGALGLQFGGLSYYKGVEVSKPKLGFKQREFDPEDIPKSIRLMVISAWISLVFMMVLSYATALCKALI